MIMKKLTIIIAAFMMLLVPAEAKKTKKVEMSDRQ